jgi:hypothetical protein
VGPARPSPSADEPPKPSDALPPDTPEAVRKAADGEGEKVTVGEERGALDYLLGPTKPVEYDVPVKYDTEAGPKELTFHIQQLDGKAIIKMEDSHRKGTGPFAELDDIEFNADLAAAATLYIEDETGRQVDPRSEEFMGGMGFGAALAMETRFKFQPGLLDGVAGQVRSVSGYAPDRVGSAERAGAKKTEETTTAALGG